MSWNFTQPAVQAGWPGVPQFCGTHLLTRPFRNSLVLNDAEVLPRFVRFQVTSPVALEISAFEISAFEMSALEMSALEISALVMSALAISAFEMSAFEMSAFEISALVMSAFEMSALEISALLSDGK